MSSTENNEDLERRLIIPALTISRLSPQARALLTTLLLIEIGETYGLSVGVTNQIKTVYAFAAIIAALLMGFLSVRYNQKTLLLVGLVLGIISTIGCFLAPSFLALVVSYSLGGIAGNMILPMTTSLLGEHVKQSDRTKALGWLTAGPAAIYVLGYPIVNYIGDWRRAFLIFALPVILVAIILTVIGVPPSKSSTTKMDILVGYRGVLASKSAVACLISYGLGLGVWQIALSLGSSFFRQQFSVSRSNVVYITVVMALLYISGTLFARRLIPKYGRRNTAIASSILLGFFTILFTISLNFVLALVSVFIACFAAGVRANSSQGLNLEQLPNLRGPMMSLTSAFGSSGNLVSLSLSGYLLVSYGWGVMGLVVGLLGFVAGIILYLYAKDPIYTSE